MLSLRAGRGRSLLKMRLGSNGSGNGHSTNGPTLADIRQVSQMKLATRNCSLLRWMLISNALSNLESRAQMHFVDGEREPPVFLNDVLGLAEDTSSNKSSTSSNNDDAEYDLDPSLLASPRLHSRSRSTLAASSASTSSSASASASASVLSGSSKSRRTGKASRFPPASLTTSPALTLSVADTSGFPLAALSSCSAATATDPSSTAPGVAAAVDFFELPYEHHLRDESLPSEITMGVGAEEYHAAGASPFAGVADHESEAGELFSPVCSAASSAIAISASCASAATPLHTMGCDIGISQPPSLSPMLSAHAGSDTGDAFLGENGKEISLSRPLLASSSLLFQQPSVVCLPLPSSPSPPSSSLPSLPPSSPSASSISFPASTVFSSSGAQLCDGASDIMEEDECTAAAAAAAAVSAGVAGCEPAEEDVVDILSVSKYHVLRGKDVSPFAIDATAKPLLPSADDAFFPLCPTSSAATTTASSPSSPPLSLPLLVPLPLPIAHASATIGRGLAVKRCGGVGGSGDVVDPREETHSPKRTRLTPPAYTFSLCGTEKRSSSLFSSI